MLKYSNANLSNYKYPTVYSGTENAIRSISTDDIVYKQVSIVSKPDSVNENANFAEYDKNEIKRIYIYSDISLQDKELNSLINLYKQKELPIETLENFTNINLNENFYTSIGNPSSTEQFYEYRFIHKACIPARIYYKDELATNLVLSDPVPIYLIMPKNFILVTDKYGYFKLENNIIIQCITKYKFCGFKSQNTEVVSIGNLQNQALLNYLIDKFNKLSVQNIIKLNDGCLVGQEDHITLIWGNSDGIFMK